MFFSTPVSSTCSAFPSARIWSERTVFSRFSRTLALSRRRATGSGAAVARAGPAAVAAARVTRVAAVLDVADARSTPVDVAAPAAAAAGAAAFNTAELFRFVRNCASLVRVVAACPVAISVATFDQSTFTTFVAFGAIITRPGVITVRAVIRSVERSDRRATPAAVSRSRTACSRARLSSATRLTFTRLSPVLALNASEIFCAAVVRSAAACRLSTPCTTASSRICPVNGNFCPSTQAPILNPAAPAFTIGPAIVFDPTTFPPISTCVSPAASRVNRTSAAAFSLSSAVPLSTGCQPAAVNIEPVSLPVASMNKEIPGVCDSAMFRRSPAIFSGTMLAEIVNVCSPSSAACRAISRKPPSIRNPASPASALAFEVFKMEMPRVDPSNAWPRSDFSWNSVVPVSI